MLDEKLSGSGDALVGREGELALLEEAVGGGEGGRAAVLVGGPGIGKTSLLEAEIEIARARGARVLAVWPTGSPTQLPFAGLIDLCDAIGDDELAALPGPQRAALEAALLRGEAESGPAPAAVALGFLTAVRALAARCPVLVVIDDVQWLDATSSEVVTFVVRRLGRERVDFLLARRPGRPGELERVLSRGLLARIEVGPLSLGAVRRVLFERLGLTVSRQLLRRIMEVTEGNPLFALEIGRSLLECANRSPVDEVPLPESLEEVLASRTARLPARVRRLLLAVALSEDSRLEQLQAICGAEAIDEGVDIGVVLVEGARVRASHALLAAAVERRAQPRQRREMHLALSRAARDEQARVLHLALATTLQDGEIAARVAAAAGAAFARGDRRQALLLATQALRLTPAAAPERPQRVLTLADRLDDAGELGALTELLEAELEALPPGPLRARALLLLSDGEGVSGVEAQNAYLERALGECGEDVDLRASLLAKQADNAAAAAVAGLREAEATAVAAVEQATGPRVRRYALYALAWARALGGRPVDDLCELSRVAADPASYISASPERVAGKRLLWRGQLDDARALWGSLAALADERGELISYAMLRLHLCELELRAGDWPAAAALLDEWAESADYDAQFRPQYQRCRALLAAGRGDTAEAERWAADALARARAVACRWDELEALRAAGLAALLAEEPERGANSLRAVWEHCQREGVLDLGAFPVAPELVEALVELRELPSAQAVAGRLRALAENQRHPWGRAAALRCDALLALALNRRDDRAETQLCQAGRELERLGLRFDAARCLLSLGWAARRTKRWRTARRALEQASGAFEALGSPGWAQRARAELERVGGRPNAPGVLTPSEQRVVELAAEGRSNKEIAGSLFITVNTVEVHLTHAYRKLGVHSRNQLAKRLTNSS